jgi:MFS family permease
VAGARADSLGALIAIRFLQGVAASCAAVVAPGVVRALFDERGALRALGALGSVESLAPAIAPVIGVWLLQFGGGSTSFWVTAALAALLAAAVAIAGRRIPGVAVRRSRLGYWYLLQNRAFQRYALSQGLALASLLVFVFAMPAVFVTALGGTVRDFIVMQLLGISSFIVAANLSGTLVDRFSAEVVIVRGSLLALVGALLMLVYGLIGGREAPVIWLLFLPLNMGFGFRGPPSFLLALQVAGGDDTRASALIIMYVMLFTAAATALLAPFVSTGLWPAALAATVLGAISIAILFLLPLAGLAPRRRSMD